MLKKSKKVFYKTADRIPSNLFLGAPESNRQK